jgi:hypothetical protein
MGSIDYGYLRAVGLDHQQAVFKLELYALLDDYKRELRGPNRPGVLGTIKDSIARLHGRVSAYTGNLEVING